MTDRRSLPQPSAPQSPLSTYVGDYSALPKATIADIPEPPKPSWLDTARASARTMIDEQTLPQEVRLISGYQDLAERLQASGVPRERMMSVPGISMLERVISFGQADADNRRATLDYELVWDQVTAARERDKGAFKDIPATWQEFDRWVLSRKGGRQRDQQTVANGPMTAALAGGAVGSMADPINIATTVAVPGALGVNVARRILAAGAANAGVEAAMTPLYVQNKDNLGEEVTGGEIAMNIVVAGGGGSLLQGAGELGAVAAKRLATPAGQMADRARRLIGWERMTPDERDAVRTLEREADIVATSPFDGVAADAHVTRVDRGVAAAREGFAPPPPATRPAVARTPAPVGMARTELKRRIGRAESPSDTARNPNSTAVGRYQFVEDTWASYYRRTFGDTGESAATIMAKRTDGAVQERVMDTLVADNAKALARIGAPETAGNLYLSHFAGQGGAAKILRAAPDTPIEQLLTARAIAANPFLRGKTAGDVVEWAHAKMGEAPHSGPVLRRDDFDADEDFAAAQREVDAAEAEMRAADRDAEDLDGPFADRELIDIAPERAIDPEVEPIGADWDPLPEPIVAVRDSGVRAVDDAESVLAVPKGYTPAEWQASQRQQLADDLNMNDARGAVARAAAGDVSDPAMLDDAARARVQAALADFDEMASIAYARELAPKSRTPDLAWNSLERQEAARAAAGRPPVPANWSPDAPNAEVRTAAQASLERNWDWSRANGREPQPVWALKAADGSIVGWSVSKRGAEQQAAKRVDAVGVERVSPPSESLRALATEVPIVADARFDLARDGDVQIASIEHDLRAELKAAAARNDVLSDAGRPIAFFHGGGDEIVGWRADASDTGVVSVTTDRKFATMWAGQQADPRIFEVNIANGRYGDFRNKADADAIVAANARGFDDYVNTWGAREAADWSPEQRAAKRAAFINEDAIRRGDWHYWEQPAIWRELGWDGAYMRETRGMAGADTINLAVLDASRIRPASDLIAQPDDNASMRFQIGEDGDSRSLAEIFDELDGDAAALATLRGCL